MKTNIYIDGFNLYYGCLRGSPYRWLDVRRLVVNVLNKHHAIHRIRYFTAMVTGTSDDPQKHIGQGMYLRALGTLPDTSTHFGRFLVNTKRMPRAESGLAPTWIAFQRTSCLS